MPENRKFGRISFGTIVTVITNGQTCKGTLHDLSLNGAKIILDSPAAPTPNNPCLMRLPLSKDLTLEFQGVVVHAYESTVGIQFTQTDPESFGHLIRLMELNTGNPEKVHQELHLTD